jgi:hypothetical protein
MIRVKILLNASDFPYSVTPASSPSDFHKLNGDVVSD